MNKIFHDKYTKFSDHLFREVSLLQKWLGQAVLLMKIKKSSYLKYFNEQELEFFFQQKILVESALVLGLGRLLEDRGKNQSIFKFIRFCRENRKSFSKNLESDLIRNFLADFEDYVDTIAAVMERRDNQYGHTDPSYVNDPYKIFKFVILTPKIDAIIMRCYKVLQYFDDAYDETVLHFNKSSDNAELLNVVECLKSVAVPRALINPRWKTRF